VVQGFKERIVNVFYLHNCKYLSELVFYIRLKKNVIKKIGSNQIRDFKWFEII